MSLSCGDQTDRGPDLRPDNFSVIDRSLVFGRSHRVEVAERHNAQISHAIRAQSCTRRVCVSIVCMQS